MHKGFASEFASRIMSTIINNLVSQPEQMLISTTYLVTDFYLYLPGVLIYE